MLKVEAGGGRRPGDAALAAPRAQRVVESSQRVEDLLHVVVLLKFVD